MIIDKNSPLPIYHQLEEGIGLLIESGELAPGDFVSSERELSEKYGISRMTVRQAINNLVNRGLLVRKHGVGTQVVEKKMEQTLQGVTSFTEDMIRRGKVPGSQVLSFHLTDAALPAADKLGIDSASPVYEIKRIRLADGMPIAYETSILPHALFPGLTEQAAQGSLYSYVEETENLAISHASQVLEASVAGKSEAEVLGVREGAPVLFIERISYLTGGRAFEWVTTIYRADRYKFVIDLNRENT
jgi:GntR family transcriptional regulator